MLNAPLEQHYVQLDGVVDYGYAAGGVQGISAAGWTLIFKVARQPVATSNSCFGCVYDDTAPAYRNNIQAMYYIHDDKVGGDGHRAVNGGLMWYYTSPVVDQDQQQVCAVTFRNVATRQSRVLVAQRGVTVADSGGVAHVSGGAERTPLHVSVGWLAQATHTAGTARSALPMIATVAVAGEATEAEVQRYSLVADARAVWPASRLWGYWPASLMYLDEGTWKTRNLGSGTGQIPITWSGPTAADLVRLAA